MISKYTNKKLITILTFLISYGFICSAQIINVEGVVSDNTGTLPGVNIFIKGLNKGTITDVNGHYNISVDQSASLTFRYTGYETQIIQIDGKKKINVMMTQSALNLDEVVVVGYGSMKKRDVTGAITSINAKDLTDNNPTNIASALQGKVAGLDIVSSSEPGQSSSFRIRGASTVSSEGSEPLFIVDGMEVSSIDYINPRDIQSVEVLKDAASASIYGSKSANGVIIVTTKLGQKGKPKISVNYSVKQSQISRKLPQMNRQQGLDYELLRAYLQKGSVLSFYSDSLNPASSSDNNYQDLLFRTANTHQVDLSISGADGKLKYFISGGYLNDQGIQINTFNNRLTTRINVDYNVTDKLTVGNRLTMAIGDYRQASWGSRSNILSRPAYMALQYDDGTYAPVMSSRTNPLAYAMLGVNDNKIYDINANEFLEFSIFKGLKLKSSISASFNQNNYQNFQPALLVQTFIPSSINQDATSFRWTQENVLSYNKNFSKDHTISAIGGFSLQGYSYEYLKLSVSDNITEAIQTSAAYNTVNIPQTFQSWTGNKMASLFGRFSYNYKSKYMLNTNLRYDGSSRFGSDKRWGLFPSVSLGWRFSDENFMEWSKSVLNDGKLRYSFGKTGNQSAGDFASLSQYSISGYSNYVGLFPTQLENNLLSWETTMQNNAGIDLSFFNNRINLSFDYYAKKTTDILFNMKLPGTTGFNSSFVNFGGIDNNGYEISISTTNVKSKSFEWSTTLNIGVNKNKITSIPKEAVQIVNDVYILDNGYTLGTMYGYKALQIFPYDQSNGFTPEWEQLTPVYDSKDRFVKYQFNGQDYTGEVKKLRYASQTGEIFKGGDVMWDDINHDGVIDLNDRQIIGNGQPDFTGGFNSELKYKNLTISTFFTFSVGGDVYNKYESTRSDHKWSTLTMANPVNVANSWQSPGDIAKYPQPSSARNLVDNTRTTSSLWVEDGSYIRLKNVKIDYNLPKSWLRALKLESASISIIAQDFFTWTNYSGFDPEIRSSGFTIGYDNVSYPKAKSILLGLNVNF